MLCCCQLQSRVESLTGARPDGRMKLACARSNLTAARPPRPRAERDARPAAPRRPRLRRRGALDGRRAPGTARRRRRRRRRGVALRLGQDRRRPHGHEGGRERPRADAGGHGPRDRAHAAPAPAPRGAGGVQGRQDARADARRRRVLVGHVRQPVAGARPGGARRAPPQAHRGARGHQDRAGACACVCPQWGRIVPGGGRAGAAGVCGLAGCGSRPPRGGGGGGGGGLGFGPPPPPPPPPPPRAFAAPHTHPLPRRRSP